MKLRTLCSPSVASLPYTQLTFGDKRKPTDDTRRCVAVGESPSAIWLLENLAERFTHDEAEALWSRFAPIEASLLVGGGRTVFVPGFQAGDSEYFFETVPAFGDLGEGGEYVAAWVEGWASAPPPRL